jgi:hypothetical protein
LIGCFFLSWTSGITVSGLDIVKSPGGNWEKYIPAPHPPFRDHAAYRRIKQWNYPIAEGLWAWLPLLTLLFWMIGIPMIHGMAIGDVFKAIGKGYGIGLWITIAASLVLAFYNPK